MVFFLIPQKQFLFKHNLIHVKTKHNGPAVDAWRRTTRNDDLEPWLIAVSIYFSYIIGSSGFVDISYGFYNVDVIASQSCRDKYIFSCASSDKPWRSSTGFEIDSGELITIRAIDAIALDSDIMTGHVSFHIFYPKKIRELHTDCLFVCR